MWEEGAVNVMWLGMGREAQKSSQISPYWPTALPTKLPTDTPSCGIAWQATKNRLKMMKSYFHSRHLFSISLFSFFFPFVRNTYRPSWKVAQLQCQKQITKGQIPIPK